jgi:peptidoglycan L-alanyl-D-glutamate endopeptidase CwlK
VDVLVYCTLRTAEEQAELYARGRTKPGPKVTMAAPWQSWHQYGRAVDAVPLVHGKPLWRYDGMRYEWQVFADEARAAGLEWSGDWKRFKEYVHVQDTGGMTVAQAYKAVRPETDIGVA